MPAQDPSDTELSAYLDEMLPTERSAEIESLLRARSELRQRAALLARRRDQGAHSVGEAWRRHRISCLSRTQLGSYLLGVADPELEDYIQFHLDVVGCRFCRANVEDLQTARQDDDRQSQRQRRYFESSAGYLRGRSSE